MPSLPKGREEPSEGAMSDKGRSFDMGYYLVALVDILGQKEKLLNLTELPTSSEEHDRFINILRDTYGAVETCRNSFDTFFKAHLKEPSKDFPLPPQLQQQFETLRATSVKIQQFADTVIVYVPLRTNAGQIPLNGIYAALLACSSTFVTMLAGGLACRGGIDIGLASEFHEGEIYGPALNSAYDLERHVAQYPRIVAGQCLVDYLDQHARAPGDDILARYTRALAMRCIELFAHDVDGRPFLDVLGVGYEQAVTRAALEDIIPEAHAFVVEQAQRAKEHKNVTKYTGCSASDSISSGNSTFSNRFFSLMSMGLLITRPNAPCSVCSQR